MGNRLLAIGLCVTVLLGVCLLRVSYLASDGEFLQQASAGQSTMKLTVANARGTIYDRHLLPLTNTATEIRAAVTPQANVLPLLREQLSTELAEGIEARLQEDTPVVVGLPQWLSPIAGVRQFEVPVRYSQRQLATHVIGYVDSAGTAGITGVEYACNELLSTGGELSVTYTVNGLGHILPDGEVTVSDSLSAARAGVALTLDADIQRLAEAAATMTRGAVVITDASTAEILALVSRPDYRPTAVEAALTASGSPLLNRAITDYNCGSVFKIVTAAAALETGVPTDRRYTCTGSLKVGDTTFHCHHRLGHGELTMTEAFAVSCNPYFIQLAQEIGSARLYDMAASLGFGRALPLCEGWQTARAVLPSLSDLLASSAELANLSFGQGSLLATPTHMAALVGAVVNDGRYMLPTLLAGMVDATGSLIAVDRLAATRVFSTETAAALRHMMCGVMTDGTGQSAQPKWQSAAGKTGTAETGWYEEGKEVIQSWVVGYYPADEPRYTVTVLVENSEQTDETAAPIFKTLCESLYFYGLQA